VTSEVDVGPILAQEAVAVRPDDTEATLHERIKQVERRLYPRTIRAYLAQLAELAEQAESAQPAEQPPTEEE
jgi:phosphoribosylglycinamide formyltransferase-1